MLHLFIHVVVSTSLANSQADPFAINACALEIGQVSLGRRYCIPNQKGHFASWSWKFFFTLSPLCDIQSTKVSPHYFSLKRPRNKLMFCLKPWNNTKSTDNWGEVNMFSNSIVLSWEVTSIFPRLTRPNRLNFEVWLSFSAFMLALFLLMSLTLGVHPRTFIILLWSCLACEIKLNCS